MKVRLKLIRIISSRAVKHSFNSMKVRLKRMLATRKLLQYLFQFHEGPIKTRRGRALRSALSLFQFHEGPIKTATRDSIKEKAVRFNSMKVRLKRGVMAAAPYPRAGFNSMKVRLKRHLATRKWFPIRCFNSMKVRLKLLIYLYMDLLGAFQFHEGPIKTSIEQSVSPETYLVSIP